MKLVISILCVIFFLPLGVRGQDLFYKIYNHRVGAPSNTIYDLAVDPAGYICLGTDCGIFTFNGRQFKEVSVDQSKATTFTDLQFDGLGRMWARNFSDELFCMENDTLRQVTQYFGSKKSNLLISRLICDNDKVYINSGLYILRLNLTSLQVDTLVHKEEFEDASRLWDFMIAEDDRIYLKSDYDFWLKIPGQRLRKIGEDLPPSVLYEDGKFKRAGGRIFYTPFVQNAIYVYEWDAAGGYKKIGTDKGPNLKLFQTVLSGDKLWLCSTKGLYELEEDGSLRLLLPEDYQAAEVVRDFEGGYWVSTQGQGLIYVPSLRMRRTGPGRGAITVLAGKGERESNILAGSNLGWIMELDTSGREVIRYNNKTQNHIEFLYFDSVYSRVYHPMGYHNSGVSEVAVFSYLGKGLIALDKQHFVVGTSQGAFVLHKDLVSPLALPPSFLASKETPISPEWQKKEEEGYARLIHSGRVRATWDGGKTGLFFVAFIDGLYAYNRNNRLRAESILSENGTPLYVTSLTGSGDTLWAGTFAQGLYGIKINDKSSEIFAHYTTENGLSARNCKKVFLYGNDLWVVTNNGTNLLHVNSGIMENISLKYSFETSFVSDVLATPKFVWLSTDEGILRLDNRMNALLPDPRLIVKKVSYGQVNYPTHPKYIPNFGSSGGELELEFEFISFRNQQPLAIEYRINEGTWVAALPNQKKLTLSNLDPNQYTLELRIKSQQQNKIPQYKLEFSISRQFWLRWQVILLILVIGFSAVALLANQYIGRSLADQRLRRALSDSQLTSLRARMSPHFFHNALNSVQSALKENRGQDNIVLLEKLSLLMRIVLNISEHELTNLQEELESAILYLEIESIRLAPNLCISVINDIPQKTLKNGIFVPSMIIQPIAENAIKHGLSHRNQIQYIAILANIDNNQNVCITITDNGIGRLASTIINNRRKKNKGIDLRTPNAKFASFATNAITERISLINTKYNTNINISTSDLYDDSGHPKGTEIKITIPLDFAQQNTTLNNP